MQILADKDTIFRSILTRLDPAGIQVDSRNLKDRLAFIASLAELIIYFDENNNQAGNWRPFIIKEPMVFLAVISKTSYQEFVNRYSQLRPALRQLGLQSFSGKVSERFKSPNGILDQVFDLLDRMFLSINEWMNVMEEGSFECSLRKIMTHRVRQSLSFCLEQRISLQRYLSQTIKDYVGPLSYSLFADFVPIWKNGSAGGIKPVSLGKALGTLDQVYLQVMSSYVQFIEEAGKEFDLLGEQSCHFPDIALLIAFHDLLTYSQNGLNQFSFKHLQFYYKDILHQHILPATQDRVYLCLKLARGVKSIELAAGEEFLGGHYPDNSPILFKTLCKNEINNAQIGNLISSNYLLAELGKSSSSKLTEIKKDNRSESGEKGQTKKKLKIHILPDSTQVRRNPSRQILSSDWFGGELSQHIQQGFVLASPMLVLGSGFRNVSIHFILDCAVDIVRWKDAECWLSSSQKWIKVPDLQWEGGEDKNEICLSFALLPDFPAVSSFEIPPASYDLDLPYCRIMLPDSVDLQEVPRLLRLTIKTSVEQSTSFFLGNDSCPLAQGKVIPVFGAISEKGNHCYLHDPEAFGKPLTQFSLDLVWDKIPADFKEYYAAYNHALHKEGKEKHVFENDVFKVLWQVQSASGWQDIACHIFPFSEQSSESTKRKLFERQNKKSKEGKSSKLSLRPDVELFAQQNDEHKKKLTVNSPGTRFSLIFSDCPFYCTAESGENPQLRMVLTEPSEGFGASLYAPLVTETCLLNAKILMNGEGLLAPIVKSLREIARLIGFKSLGETLPLPELPWVVKAVKAVVSYSAEQSLDFSVKTQTSDGYFALLHIGPFATYPYYFRSGEQDMAEIDQRDIQFVVGAKDVSSSRSKGLALFPGVNNPGNCLYMQLVDVILPCRVNLMIEFASTIIGDSEQDIIELYYWGQSGWRPLPVLLDQTSALNRSGILQIDLPQDAVFDPSQFFSETSRKSVWLLITQSSNRRISCIYCNTQGIELVREKPILLPQGVAPAVAAGKITSLLKKNKSISSLIQPFASFGGSPQETDSVFHSRVSQRLRTKNRASSDWDYTLLAKQTCPGLFSIRRLKSSLPGKISFGVVQAYASAEMAHAFRPAVSLDDLQRVETTLSNRASLLAHVHIRNLRYEPVTVVAELLILEKVSACELLIRLEDGINLYLSPWIASEQRQYNLEEGLNPSAIIQFLAGFEGVSAVSALSLHAGNDLLFDTEKALSISSVKIVPSSDELMFVSSLRHSLKLVQGRGEDLFNEPKEVVLNKLTEVWP